MMGTVRIVHTRPPLLFRSPRPREAIGKKMAGFVRAYAPLIRTTRVVLSKQRGVNPVQQVFGRDATHYRGLATVFERNKPHVNIGTIGHVDHGK
ncbi:MAG: hypothetical protein L6R42_011309, partial [Xanthoria sp. 1 TBL-2021]